MFNSTIDVPLGRFLRLVPTASLGEEARVALHENDLSGVPTVAEVCEREKRPILMASAAVPGELGTVLVGEGSYEPRLLFELINKELVPA